MSGPASLAICAIREMVLMHGLQRGYAAAAKQLGISPRTARAIYKRECATSRAVEARARAALRWAAQQRLPLLEAECARLRDVLREVA